MKFTPTWTGPYLVRSTVAGSQPCYWIARTETSAAFDAHVPRLRTSPHKTYGQVALESKVADGQRSGRRYHTMDLRLSSRSTACSLIALDEDIPLKGNTAEELHVAFLIFIWRCDCPQSCTPTAATIFLASSPTRSMIGLELPSTQAVHTGTILRGCAAVKTRHTDAADDAGLRHNGRAASPVVV